MIKFNIEAARPVELGLEVDIRYCSDTVALPAEHTKKTITVLSFDSVCNQSAMESIAQMEALENSIIAKLEEEKNKMGTQLEETK